MKTNSQLVQSAISLIQASAQLSYQVVGMSDDEIKLAVQQQAIYAAKLEVLAWAIDDTTHLLPLLPAIQ